MGKLKGLLAGIAAFALVVLANPLWVSLVSVYPWLIWVFLGLGFGLMILAGAASMVDVDEAIQIVIALVGFLFFCIWFLQCFAVFTYSLI